MSEHINNGGPAFPMCMPTAAGTGVVYGMTLRDYFAAKALQAELMFPEDHRDAEDWALEVAQVSYRVADAMLRAREVKP